MTSRDAPGPRAMPRAAFACTASPPAAKSIVPEIPVHTIRYDGSLSGNCGIREGISPIIINQNGQTVR